MGHAKSEMIEAEERGWAAQDKFVCPDCFEDEYLKEVVTKNATHTQCDYCKRNSKKNIAAELAVVVEPIAGALFAHYAEPGNAGLPRDSGEWVGEGSITDTGDALESLGLACEQELFDDIADSFMNDAWYPCADGHWLEIHEHEELRYAWEAFVIEVKHRSRYFFTRNKASSSSSPGERYTALTLLRRIGKEVQRLGLVKSITQGTNVYRVRRTIEGKQLNGFDELGPPPEAKASAGRMNPAGISYFYLAFESGTALAEVLPNPPCHAALALFETSVDFRVLDLTVLPPTPSIFDSNRREERSVLIFLDRFIAAISKPVSKDGREHIDYIPSQIVSEYFAQVLQVRGEQQLEGMVYPSSLRPGGKNLVLFPVRDESDAWGRMVSLTKVSHHSYRSWSELKKVL
jgi:hypothetical protein